MHTRREIIGYGLSVAALAAAGPALALAPFTRAKGGKMKLSCSAYSFRDQLQGKDKEHPMTVEQFIDKCAGWGCDGVELTNYYFADPPTDAYLKGLKRKAFLNGLAVSGMPIRTDFCQADAEKRHEQIVHTLKWIDRASVLGAPCIRVFAGGDPKGDLDQQRKWFVECINQCLPVAEKAGIYLAVENHGGIVSTADDLLRLVDLIQHDWFGVNLDTGNFRTADPYTDLRKAAPYSVVVQFKTEIMPDGKKQPADFAKEIDILREVNYSGFVALEYEAAEPAPDAVPRHLAELKKLLSQ
ncbi:MAG: sugar phosphate isomerase/epimerase family protein [Armatimonadota bacterium]